MSGIYLTVWGETKDFCHIVKPTPEGLPCVNLAYTGAFLPLSDLKNVAKNTIELWGMSKLTLSHAYINMFYDRKKGNDRYDVLIAVKEVDQIEKTRDILIRRPFMDRYKKFLMTDPHVVANVCYSQEDAECECDRVNRILPIQVTVNGVIIE
jgi:hypothetical protein